MTWPKGKVSDLLSRRGINLKEDVALIAEVGSTMHGISIHGQDDLDLTAIRFEKWDEFVNGPIKKQSMMIRTQPNGHRSRFGDIDINVYTVRKFASLAATGNPSIILIYDVPNKWLGRFQWVNWEQLQAYTTSRRAGAAYRGYMKQQLERWQGKRGQKNINRPELVERYGFDTKYAGHVVRLGYQGIEYLETGSVSLPMPEEQQEEVKAIRVGSRSEHDALNLAAKLESRLSVALAASELPEQANLYGVHKWLADTYQEVYRRELA